MSIFELSNAVRRTIVKRCYVYPGCDAQASLLAMGTEYGSDTTKRLLRIVGSTITTQIVFEVTGAILTEQQISQQTDCINVNVRGGTCDAIISLSPAQVQSVPAAQISALAPQFIPELSNDQVLYASPAQVPFLSTEQISSILASQLTSPSALELREAVLARVKAETIEFERDTALRAVDEAKAALSIEKQRAEKAELNANYAWGNASEALDWARDNATAHAAANKAQHKAYSLTSIAYSNSFEHFFLHPPTAHPEIQIEVSSPATIRVYPAAGRSLSQFIAAENCLSAGIISLKNYRTILHYSPKAVSRLVMEILAVYPLLPVAIDAAAHIGIYGAGMCFGVQLPSFAQILQSTVTPFAFTELAAVAAHNAGSTMALALIPAAQVALSVAPVAGVLQTGLYVALGPLNAFKGHLQHSPDYPNYEFDWAYQYLSPIFGIVGFSAGLFMAKSAASTAGNSGAAYAASSAFFKAVNIAWMAEQVTETALFFGQALLSNPQELRTSYPEHSDTVQECVQEVGIVNVHESAN